MSVQDTVQTIAPHAGRRPSAQRPGRPAHTDALIDARTRIDTRLSELASQTAADDRLSQAMRHSLMAPGKRLRPLMCFLVAESAGRSRQAALDAGCAIEMVHTASLVLDDLPAMDDATERRGQPCTHRVFGEGTAILVGVSLINRAFEVLACLDGVEGSSRARAVRVLAEVSGPAGLSAGQERDLRDRATCTRVDEIDAMNDLKTGVLFAASVEIGGILAGLQEPDLDRLRRFARCFGRAFQTADDLEDASPVAGPGASPRERALPSLASLVGRDAARRRIDDDLWQAREALAGCRIDPAPLGAVLDHFQARLPA